jgi:Zn-dependent M28 family amino/carboxypeptidase
MRRPAAILLVLGAAACGGTAPQPIAIEASAIEAHMRLLASDDLAGRAAGTPGYMAAAEYVAGEFEKIGLEPAGPDAGYFQPVPLVAAHLLADESTLTVRRGDAETRLEIETDFVLQPDFLREGVELRAPLVYAGFGVVAPEYGYDDFAGIEVSGKIVVLLRGAPSTFGHDERAFHSASDVKLRTAVEHGAAGVVYMQLPSDRENDSWEGSVAESRMPAMRWLNADGSPHGAFEELFVVAALSSAGEARLLEGENRTLEAIFAAAEAGQPASFDLAADLEVFTVSRHERMKSPNVIARLPGSDPALAAEHVVLTAHLDHLGSMPIEAGGDGIHNGAYDNASGVAMLIEVARAMVAAGAPRRSILFMAVTAEEKGLLGSDYFAEYPTVAVDRLVANVNLDMVLMLHPLADIVAYGAAHSSLEQAVERAAAAAGLRVGEDPSPELVFFVRSDQFSFVQRGVPSIFLVSGFDAGEREGLEMFHAWMRGTYHTPADDMSQPIDFEAGADFARLNLRIVTDVANADERPRWNDGDFFGERFGR